jgi:hypothetical protein
MLVSLSYCKELLSLDDRDIILLDHHITIAGRIACRHMRRNILLHTCCRHEDSRGQGEILLEYPVRSLDRAACDPDRLFTDETALPPEAYSLSTALGGAYDDIPSSMLLDPFLNLPRGRRIIEITYQAGYAQDEMPEDIRAAIVEIVAWNRKRYSTGRIGTAGGGKTDNTPEPSLPENVAALLAPYVRRTW